MANFFSSSLLSCENVTPSICIPSITFQSPVVPTSIDSASTSLKTSQNILPLFVRPPPTIFPQQCSRNAFSSLNYGLKFLNTNSYKKSTINQPPLYYNQILDDRNAFLNLPQFIQRRNYNDDKCHQLYAQQNQIISPNCFNFSLNLNLQQSHNCNFPFSSIQNKCDKSLTSSNCQQIHYQRQHQENSRLTGNSFSLFTNDASFFLQNGFHYLTHSSNIPTLNSSLFCGPLLHQVSPIVSLSSLKDKTEISVLPNNKVFLYI